MTRQVPSVDPHDGDLPCCPECGPSRVRRRHHGNPRSVTDTTDLYRCEGCQATFSHPDYREPKRQNNRRPPSVGLASKLWQASPGDLGGDRDD